jgi:hypothetical protein
MRDAADTLAAALIISANDVRADPMSYAVNRYAPISLPISTISWTLPA